MAVARESTAEIARRMAEAASAWLDALEPEQRTKASLNFDDVEERTSWAYFPRMTQGLPLLEMDPRQQKLLAELIAVYVERLPEPLAEIERGRIERAGIEGVHFAWAGETERRRPHYYRLQGPSFLVEYDNTQNDANHLHSVWRNPDRDFGGDLLGEHLRQAH